MQNFYLYDRFFSDLGDLCDNIGDDDEINALDDDWSVQANECSLEPLFKLSPDSIMQSINEDRFTEDGEEYDKAYRVLNDNIDFEKINSLIPKLWYTTKKAFIITKSDLLEYIKQ